MPAANTNDIWCDLSSAHVFAEFWRTVVAVANVDSEDQLMVLYKCTFTKQDLFVHESGFEKDLYVQAHQRLCGESRQRYRAFSRDRARRLPSSRTTHPVAEEQS